MNAFNTLTNESKIEAAMQMVILDAIEKGHTCKSEMIDYMQSPEFEKQVKAYIQFMGN